MKKVIKISLAVVAALLIFLNVSLNLNGNKVEGMNLTTTTQIAQAWDGYCYYIVYSGDCFCKSEYYPCGGICPSGSNGSLCEGA